MEAPSSGHGPGKLWKFITASQLPPLSVAVSQPTESIVIFFEKINLFFVWWRYQMSIIDGLPHALQVAPYVHAIKASWNRPYLGENAVAFVHDLNNMHRSSRDLYSNSAFLIQSSGTGKSRMLHEASKLVFTIPANLRDPEDSKSLAYPHPDVLLREIMVGHYPKNDNHRFHSYFAALFQVVVLRVQSLLGASRVKTYEELAREWSRHLDEHDGQHRRSLYEETRDEIRIKYMRGEVPKEAMYHSLQTLLDILLALPSDSLCGEGSNPDSQDVRLLLYYDEAHELSTNGWPFNQPRYLSLLTCIHQWLSRTTQAMAVFASTSFNIDPVLSNAFPPIRPYGVLQAPQNETPFNNSPQIAKLHKSTWTLTTSSTLEFVAQFGRPLWWTMLEGAEPGREREIKFQIMALARGKLLFLNSREVEGGYDTVPSTALAAMLDVLLNIDLEPWPETLQLQLRLVSHHMQLVFTVPHSRNHVVSGYLPEPILAEVAARQLHWFMSQEKGRDVLSQLPGRAFFRKNDEILMIHRRRRDETILRLLIMAAYVLTMGEDPVLQNDTWTLYHAEPSFSRGASLISFIEHLFPEDLADQVLNSVPTNIISGRPLREVFRNSAIRVTHFARADGDSAMTVHAMKEACLCAMGFICEIADDIVDLMIPILLDRTGPIVVENMSAIMWRIRRCHSFGLPNLPDWQLFPPNHENHEAPYISILSDVGAWSNSRKPSAEDVEQSQPWTYHNRSNMHPMYNVFTYGCSSAVFNVVGKDEEKRYEALLKVGVDPFYKSKPESVPISGLNTGLWFTGAKHYSWIEDDFLQQPSTPRKVDVQDHFVAIGTAARACVTQAG